MKILNGKKFYPVGERWLFGLESMRDKASYMIECTELSDEEYDKWYGIREECEDLLFRCSSGWVEGKYFPRIKDLTYAREQIRFNTCIENGMSYKDAAPALRGM